MMSSISIACVLSPRVSENRAREASNQYDDADMRDARCPMLLQAEKQRGGDDRSYRQDDGDDEKVLACAECVRSSYESRRCHDVENENPVPRRDRTRAES